jgi:hypothetical protein
MTSDRPAIHLWDVFICHATEDKDNFVRPLADILRREGVKVWYDEFEIQLGDSIVRKIERGLANSNSGVVVLSRHSLQKKWAQHEANAIRQLHLADRIRLIPIFWDVSMNEIRELSPGLLDLKGIDANEKTVAECAFLIIRSLRPDILSRIHIQYADRKLREAGESILVNSAEIRSGPKLREKLPEVDIIRISVLHACFLEIFNDALADWIESFCHDLYYEREIRVWERMATCYLRCVGDKHYSREIKVRIFGILLALFTGTESGYLEKGFSKLPKGVSRRLQTILKLWLDEWGETMKFIIEPELSDQIDMETLRERGEELHRFDLEVPLIMRKTSDN